jgi:hypothetical protein
MLEAEVELDPRLLLSGQERPAALVVAADKLAAEELEVVALIAAKLEEVVPGQVGHSSFLPVGWAPARGHRRPLPSLS